MASWIEDTLEPGETIVYRARPTWRQVWCTAVFCSVLLFCINYAQDLIFDRPLLGFFEIGIVIALLYVLVSPLRTRETVITNRRLLLRVPVVLRKDETHEVYLDEIVALEQFTGFLGNEIRLGLCDPLHPEDSSIEEAFTGPMASTSRFVEQLLTLLPADQIALSDETSTRNTFRAIIATACFQMLSGVTVCGLMMLQSWSMIEPLLQNGLSYSNCIIPLGLFLLAFPCFALTAYLANYIAIFVASFVLDFEEMVRLADRDLPFAPAFGRSRLARRLVPLDERLISWLYRRPVTLRVRHES